MDWLKQIAPTIATALGGPLAGMAVSAISKSIGVDEAKVGDLISNNKLTADQIAQVITDVRKGYIADGTGVKEPVPSELPDRDWRADPSDGLRPLKAIRSTWRP